MENIADFNWFEEEAKRKIVLSRPLVEQAESANRKYHQALKGWLDAEKELGFNRRFLIDEWPAMAKLLYRQQTVDYLRLHEEQQEAWHVTCEADRQRDNALARIDQFLDQGLAIHDQGYIARKTILLAMVDLTLHLGSLGYSSRLVAQSGKTPQASSAALQVVNGFAAETGARIYKCDAALRARQGFDGLAELTGPLEAGEFIQALEHQPFDRKKCNELAGITEKLRQALQKRTEAMEAELYRYRQEYVKRYEVKNA
ncbi:MAG: hypothetical protein NTX14_02985 [Candidatus Nealsonbacteria bacterium]|nr:hypothetical protein [Candidatus Nealsonbacteria bacterium]